jgi:RND family efflux transporter MFP subunit
MNRNGKRILAVLGFVLILFGSALYLVQWKRNQLSEAPEYGQKPRPVTVEPSRQRTFRETRSYLAEVESSQTTRISPRVQATVDTIHVDENDRVHGGETLIELDRRAINQRIDSLKETIEQVQSEKRAQKAERTSLKNKRNYWQKEVRRFERLAREGLAPEAELDKRQETLSEVRGNFRAAQQTVQSLNHRVESLREQLSEQKTRRSYYTIESPYDARITERLVDPGTVAKPGAALLVLEDIAGARLVFEIPQNEENEIRAGRTVRFRKNKHPDTATITLVHPALNENRMLRAEVGLPETVTGGFRSGEYVPIEVVVDRYPDAVVVPRTALIESPEDRPYVYLVEDQKLVARTVDPIGHSADHVAVTGLSAGKSVVKHTYLGWTLLNSGDTVKPVQ